MSAAEISRLDQRLADLSPTFTTAQARQALLSARDLAHLVTEGEIDELSRGVYRRADAPETAYADLLAVCTRAPRAVLCGESALALHELIDDIPSAVHIAVPRGSRRPTISYPPTVVAQYAAKTFNLGVERFEAAPGETIPTYNAARSVVDAMRHRGRIGETMALSALGRYLRRSGRSGVGELQLIARELGALSVIRPAVEAVLA
ncbi:type IV toxin-antitoxin system AbiEi family antitoxin domain-containing protein [Streptomyces scopuliridis]|uniref:Type IV toxin-antitoxin system AbiEi family antitoxin domain-containing protein n=1 Tax=Streptomyces scopuliridis TaxID=452529 RepID=A0ACD4ZH76_9ACTN|nr:type IV toxin-antitoxin system AbiEi family antitoxin domain-containing protein [Streptomyces scopuliridis]WSB97534.1 type IV toxin-antitoxin system AbiEi family antitoxin domain-containing protein [Streptomyces scopuliridis]WSC08763.1 type IV toxin-antitoxin system AbiEi family antitoxin domain-containing protein [Streptomyces scopuliridis]